MGNTKQLKPLDPLCIKYRVCVCIHVCVHVCVPVYVCLRVYVHVVMYVCMCVLRTCVYPCTHNFCSALLSSLIQLYSVYLCIFDLFAVKLCINNNCRLRKLLEVYISVDKFVNFSQITKQTICVAIIPLIYSVISAYLGNFIQVYFVKMF